MQTTKKQSSSVPVIFKLGESKLQFEIPLSWSINKAKCLLTSQIPSLNFDEFQLTMHGELLRGSYKLKNIATTSSKEQPIQMEIIKRKSEIKLAQYYRQSMNKTMVAVPDNGKQPILSVQYQKYRNMVKAEKKDNNNLNDHELVMDAIDDDAEGGGNGVNPLFRALRIIGTYFILVMIYDHGKAHQIFIILSVVLCYFGLEMFVKYKQRKLKKENRQQNARTKNASDQQTNENTDEKQPKKYEQNRTLGLFKMYYYKTIEIVYTLLWTFFPNLTIEMHLQINREKIEQARAQVNRLIPNSYTKDLTASQNQNQVQNQIQNQ